MKFSPCKNCTRRSTGAHSPSCHATCEDYAEFNASREEERRRKSEEAVVHGYVITNHGKYQRSKGYVYVENKRQ